jgi:RNA polymerase sigma-70 factor, ECF subfamily
LREVRNEVQYALLRGTSMDAMSSTLARQGMQGTFDQLYRRHRADVYRFVLRDVRNPAEAEDVTQTAFLNAYRALLRGDAPEKPRAWLFTIAQNVARRRFRARSTRPQEVELDPDTLVAPEPEGLPASEIREALFRLRPSHRDVIVLREILGLSYAEVAERLDLSVPAVETLLFRARRALREELTGEQRRGLRVGGFVLPLPLGLTKGFGSLAGWLGRRVATVHVAGAVGVATVGLGVAVQTGAVGPSNSPAAREAVAPVASVRADPLETRSVRARHHRKPTRLAGASASVGADGNDGTGSVSSVLESELPALPATELPSLELPAIALPDVELPTPPALPTEDVTPLPLPDAEDLITPPPLPLPDAEDLLP